MEYLQVQNIAKQTMEYIQTKIKPGTKLTAIRKMCEDKMLSLGADSFWYWDIGAFCFAGDETIISVSGKEYETSEKIIEENDIITIDLSPQNKGIWGDYARTIIVENGKVIEKTEDISNMEWKNGLMMEDQLHLEMMRFVTLNITFEGLFYYMNDFINQNGFINLDFMGNLGHSIVKSKAERIYIEKGNDTKLSDVLMFTFEPHISGSAYGYEKADIHYFESGAFSKL